MTARSLQLWAVVCVIGLGACAGPLASPAWHYRFESRAPIDRDAILDLAAATTAEHYTLGATDRDRAAIATVLATIEGVDVLFVIRLDGPHSMGCGRRGCRQSYLTLSVTPHGYQNGHELPPEDVPAGARTRARDLVDQIRFLVQKQHLVI
jgi:hypothetical protein